MTKARDLGDNAQNTKPKVVDAKGDLIVGTGSDAADRLAVSDNGSTLVADSSQTTGLRYNPPAASLANPVINGGMDVWQRGTSFSSPNAIYVADRWKAEGSTPACTVSRQATGDTTNLPNIQYGLRFQRDSGQTNTTAVYLYTGVETANAIPFAGKTVTVSFYAKAGANYSSASSALSYFVNTGTGTDESPSGAYTGNVSAASGSVTLTTSYQRFAFTATIGATATEFKIGFNYTPVGTAGANDWFEVTGVQVDVGTWTASTAPTFRRSGNTLAGEYAAAQRYYQRIKAAQAYYRFSIGMNVSATQASFVVPFRVSMRTTPTFAASGNFESVEGTSNRGTNAPTLSTDGNNTESALLYTIIASATTGYAIQLRSANSTASYIEFSSEL